MFRKFSIPAFETIWGRPSDILKTFTGHIFSDIDIKYAAKVLLFKYGKINPRSCNQLPIQKNSFLNFALFLKLYMGLFLFSLLKFGMCYTRLYYIVHMLHKRYFIFNILYKIDKQYSIQVLFIYIYIYIHM